jgi:hypothetical protein
MNKGASLGAGLGLLTLLGGLYVAGQMSKTEVQQVDPSMAAALRGANAATIASLTMSKALYTQAKGKAPETISDMVPEFLASVPQEAFSKSSAVVKVYDGTGGWVMDDDGFKPNAPQDLVPATPVPAK